MHTRVWIAGCMVLAATGCAGLAPQQVGQMVGSVAGAAIAPGVGAPVGGLVGLLAGMVVQQQVDQVTEKHERIDLSRELKVPPTGTLDAAESVPIGKPTRVWVDETFHDGRLVPGSFQERNIP